MENQATPDLELVRQFFFRNVFLFYYYKPNERKTKHKGVPYHKNNTLEE